MLQDLREVRGFCFLYVHSDVAQAIAESSNISGSQQVLYWRPADISHSVGLNPSAIAGFERLQSVYT
jgi:hypothetical protein